MATDTTAEADRFVHAWRTLRSATRAPMLELEDAWHRRALAPVDATAALAAVGRACRQVGTEVPESSLPAAWMAWAEARAAEGALPLQPLRARAAAATADPYPRVLLARALLSRYAAATELPNVKFVDQATQSAAFTVSPSARADLDEARALLHGLRDDPVLARDDGGVQLRAFLLGALALAEGRHRDAANALAGVADDPLLAGDAAVLRALALLQLGEPRAAAELFERLQARGWPDTTEKAAFAWLGLAQRAVADGGPVQDLADRSVTMLDDLVRRYPRDGNGWVNRAIVCSTVAGLVAQQGADPLPWHERALADLDHALELEPGAYRVLHTRAALRVRHAQQLRARPRSALALLDGAIADFSSVVDRNPEYVLSWMGRCQARRLRARVVARLGQDPVPDLEHALADAEAGVLRAADSDEARQQRAGVLVALGDHHLARGLDARPWFRRAVPDRQVLAERAPGDAPRRFELGIARLGLAASTAAEGGAAGTLWEAAIADLEAAARLDPTDPRTQRRLGHCRLLAAVDGVRSGKDPTEGVQAAIAALDRCLELDPQEAAALVWRAKAHDYRGDRAAALRDLAAAEAIRPGHPEQARLRRAWGG